MSRRDLLDGDETIRLNSLAGAGTRTPMPWREVAAELWAARYELLVIAAMTVAVLAYIWIGVS